MKTTKPNKYFHKLSVKNTFINNLKNENHNGDQIFWHTVCHKQANRYSVNSKNENGNGEHSYRLSVINRYIGAWLQNNHGMETAMVIKYSQKLCHKQPHGNSE